MADKLAKAGSSKDITNKSPDIDLNFLYKEIDNVILAKWQKHYDSSNIAKHYKS